MSPISCIIRYPRFNTSGPDGNTISHPFLKTSLQVALLPALWIHQWNCYVNTTMVVSPLFFFLFHLHSNPFQRTAHHHVNHRSRVLLFYITLRITLHIAGVFIQPAAAECTPFTTTSSVWIHSRLITLFQNFLHFHILSEPSEQY